MVVRKRQTRRQWLSAPQILQLTVTDKRLTVNANCSIVSTLRHCVTDRLRAGRKYDVQWRLQSLRRPLGIHNVLRDGAERSSPSARRQCPALNIPDPHVAVVHPLTRSPGGSAVPSQSSPAPRCRNGRTVRSRNAASRRRLQRKTGNDLQMNDNDDWWMTTTTKTTN